MQPPIARSDSSDGGDCIVSQSSTLTEANVNANSRRFKFLVQKLVDTETNAVLGFVAAIRDTHTRKPVLDTLPVRTRDMAAAEGRSLAWLMEFGT